MKDLNLLQRHFLWVAKLWEKFSIALPILASIFIALVSSISVLLGLSGKALLILPVIVLLYVILCGIVISLFIIVNKTYVGHLLLILKDNTPVFVKDVFWGKGRWIYITGLNSRRIDIETYFSYLIGEMKYIIKVRFKVFMKNGPELDAKTVYKLLLETHSSFDDGECVDFSKIMSMIVIKDVKKQEPLFGKYLDGCLSGKITEEDLVDKVWKEVVFPKDRFDTIDHVNVCCGELQISRQI